jgi:hypothetical protein
MRIDEVLGGPGLEIRGNNASLVTQLDLTSNNGVGGTTRWARLEASGADVTLSTGLPNVGGITMDQSTGNVIIGPQVTDAARRLEVRSVAGENYGIRVRSSNTLSSAGIEFYRDTAFSGFLDFGSTLCGVTNSTGSAFLHAYQSGIVEIGGNTSINQVGVGDGLTLESPGTNNANFALRDSTAIRARIVSLPDRLHLLAAPFGATNTIVIGGTNSGIGLGTTEPPNASTYVAGNLAVGINSTPPTFGLDVLGNTYLRGNTHIGANSTALSMLAVTGSVSIGGNTASVPANGLTVVGDVGTFADMGVGLGITNPSERLHVSASGTGGIRVEASTSPIVSLRVGATQYGVIAATSSLMAVSNGGGTAFFNFTTGGEIQIRSASTVTTATTLQLGDANSGGTGLRAIAVPN